MIKLRGNRSAYETLAGWTAGGRLPHAVLLEGPAGCGKKTFAAAIAQAALCGEADGPCGVCRDCVKLEKGVHPDFRMFAGEGRARSFHIDRVREIRAEAWVSPNEARGKVFLIDGAQDLSVQAQNALLKTLEEPPRGVTFVLTCENRASLLETILSRVTVVALAVPTPEECALALAERGLDASPEDIQAAAREAAGNVGKALAALEKEAGGRAEDAGAVVRALIMGDELLALEKLSAYERDRSGLLELIDAMRRVVVTLLFDSSDRQDVAELKRRANPLLLMKIVAIMDEIYASTQQNAAVSLACAVLCARVRGALSGG